ncbi:SDR family oxidoreductase [Rhodoblastus acidophilus]|uniref:SDR family oxidoreductase n=1 Tax=Candidatus Rhodoblastus alkanivorans TaxID=2954117 RepID=A0ABS9Z611_9HYPH|nr:SDR family oxidoreductase [Candidatus Rhodoblastus alkanivorans]MCI4680295.1 SDR family oxidoreductase [Candidatus Rhodoblastus alkanivorans]MCI4683114.1 SDR family oxidoreductase [Candidatus Rhodoblastus alkanivorans]MDI4640425.1 SDR family oxidoreductase [Rhodoblastus acidophilus]
MKILVTGNQGYIGPILGRHLRRVWPDAHLIGYDTGYFALSTTNAKVWPERVYDEQINGDVRDLPANVLEGVDGVVQLAAISNDPMGANFAEVTDQVNRGSAVRIARLAADAGVKHFVFASSCSVYGFAPGGARREEDSLNPQTAYARSKIDTENALAEMDLKGMITTSLRFATACGMSDRLRLDLVLNDFVAGAIASGKITVLSDGTPWRPLIDVRDMSRAIEWALTRDSAKGGQLLRINIGSDEWNYQVKDLANAVAAAVPGTTVSINTQAQPDTRSYKVDFALFRSLAPDHQPQITLARSIELLREGLAGMGFADAEFRSSPFMRLKMLQAHIEAGRLTPDLRWNEEFLERV